MSPEDLQVSAGMYSNQFPSPFSPEQEAKMLAFFYRNADKIVPLPPCFDPPCHPLPITINLRTGEVAK